MTLADSDEPAYALDGIKGEGVVRLRHAACKTRMVEVVVTPDAQFVSSAGPIAVLLGGQVVDQTRSLSGSRSLLAGGHR
jgi:ABC-type dipeptide/oligopeptide/nickel transport system ATPase component